MKVDRRNFLKLAGGGSALALLAGSGLLPRLAWAVDAPLHALAPGDDRKEFEAHTLDELVKALGGTGAQASTHIDLSAPEIAENGAVVPIEIQSKLPNTRMIAVVCENNPNALTAAFHLPDGTEPYISMRMKLAETAKVTALVQTDQGFFYTDRMVKVTLGGCGG
ncbi:MAG TPA: thiosulfate oxidation carrier protein SoxY [Rhodanobacteraceae bacterium]|nr:thiosulfate oxidation carrier protein SoxY [Rhodanobacteraceae bacterium]